MLLEYVAFNFGGSLNFKICVMAMNIFKIKYKIKKKKSKAIKIVAWLWPIKGLFLTCPVCVSLDFFS